MSLHCGQIQAKGLTILVPKQPRRTLGCGLEIRLVGGSCDVGGEFFSRRHIGSAVIGDSEHAGIKE
jgi:hypothetical protein